MTSSKLIAVIVTFKPDLEVRQNILKIMEQVGHLVIVDNASNESSMRVLTPFFDGSQITLIKNPENEGIAKALNQGLKEGIQRGGEYFILFDQDSCPKDSMIAHLHGAVEQSQNLVIAGPILEDRKTGVLDVNTHNISPFSEKMLITSGSFFSKAVVDKIGFMDEKLFIDYVDHDYCLRLKKAGGDLLRVPTARLLHSLGEAETRTFLGRTFFLQAYSPLRRYYMARNRIILYSRYPQVTQPWFRNDVLFVVKDYMKLLVFERNRFQKISAIVKGSIDGIKMVLWKSR